MKYLTIILLFCFSVNIYSQEKNINHKKIKEDLKEILSDLSNNYVYLNDKGIDINCLNEYYGKQIQKIKTKEEIVLFFEYLLNEFCDSHLILNTNTKSSFRLYSPIYVKFINGKFLISDVWFNQIKNLKENIINAEIIEVNGVNMKEVIEKFPTHCNDKTSHKVKEWIANKVLAGHYNKPRILNLKLANNKNIVLDLDKLSVKTNSELLNSSIIKKIGVIRINNSLGNNNLIKEFDATLKKLENTKGLILDLRNTVDGGNSYVARGIMGKFIKAPKPYQKHSYIEKYDNKTNIERSWVEYVSPRKKVYQKPLVVLVGRWTGSMGEGMAIGFDGMKRGIIVGSEMERLAGEVNGFYFKNQKFGYRIPTAKIYHINGTAREEYRPKNYIQQTTLEKDEVLERGGELIEKLTK